MPIDNETVTTQTDAEQNSDQSTSTSASQEQGSATSTTEATEKAADAETIDLGKTPDAAADKADAAKEGETKDETTDAEKTAAAETAKLFGAPEGDAGYELTGLPEGTVIDEKALAEVTPIFKQLGLSNEGASLIAATYAEKVLPKVAEQVVSNLENDIVEQRRTWEGEARDQIKGVDKDGNKIELKNALGETLSYDGRSLKDVQAIAAKALDRFGTPDLRAFLDQTGMGVHPALIAFAYNAGKNIAEDMTLERTGAVDQPKSRAEKYYT